MDFAGLLPKIDRGHEYIVLAVEHLSDWPIVKATQREAASVATELAQVEVLQHFGAPRNIVTKNGPAFVVMEFR